MALNNIGEKVMSIPLAVFTNFIFGKTREPPKNNMNCKRMHPITIVSVAKPTQLTIGLFSFFFFQS